MCMRMIRNTMRGRAQKGSTQALQGTDVCAVCHHRDSVVDRRGGMRPWLWLQVDTPPAVQAGGFMASVKKFFN